MVPGWLYVLIDPSLDGMVKIGKTMRPPEERARELTSATGVPTPFHLAYKVRVADCDQAEAYIHSLLSAKGHRVSDNPEFFSVPLDEVVRLMEKVRIRFEVKSEESDDSKPILDELTGDEFLNGLAIENDFAPTNEWDEIEDLADCHYYGLREYLQDYSEALRLYKQAAALGSPTAHEKLGDMYRDGEGTWKDASNSLKHYKKAVVLGIQGAYMEMAELYRNLGHAENEMKCQVRYFNSSEFLDDERRDSAERALRFIGRQSYGGILQGELPHRERLALKKEEMLEILTRRISDVVFERFRDNLLQLYSEIKSKL